MSIKGFIIFFLSLFGLSTTIALIVYVIKYNNLNKKYQNINNLSNQPNNCESNKKISDSNNNILEGVNNTNSKDLINNNTSQFEQEKKKLEEIIQSYDIYNNADFYNKFDLLDEYNDRIIIYSKDLINCYLACENILDCKAFSKHNNYCYLKSKYNISDKVEIPKTNLIVKKNVEFNNPKLVLNLTNSNSGSIDNEINFESDSGSLENNEDQLNLRH